MFLISRAGGRKSRPLARSVLSYDFKAPAAESHTAVRLTFSATNNTCPAIHLSKSQPVSGAALGLRDGQQTGGELPSAGAHHCFLWLFFYSPFLLLLRNLVAKDTDRAQVVAGELLPFFCLVRKRTRQMANWWSWMLLVLVGDVIAMLTERFASSCFILTSSWSVSLHAADLKGNSLYASLLAEFITNRLQTMIPLFIYSMITLLPPTKPCTANTALLFWLAVWWTIEV